MRVARRQGIKGAVLEHVCGRASVPMDLSGGAVRLHATPHGLPTRAQVSAALRRQSGGYHAGTPPSLDPTCSPPSLPNACRTLDASARAGSAVWLCGGLQIVVRAPTAGHATTPTPAQRLRDGDHHCNRSAYSRQCSLKQRHGSSSLTAGYDCMIFGHAV
jgi:hypothetical protein